MNARSGPVSVEPATAAAAADAPPAAGAAEPSAASWAGRPDVETVVGLEGGTTRGELLRSLRELVRRRDLLFVVAWREIKVKYKQSVMGFAWAVLMPALIVMAGVLVKYAFASISGSRLRTDDVVSVAVRSVPWAFFVASIRFASTSLISNSNLVTKIYMPRMIFPVASVLSQLADLGVATVVLALLLVVAGVGVGAQILWVPVLLVPLVLLVAGLGIFLSAAGLFFRDVKYIVEVIITFAIFFTPVFYDVSMFGAWAGVLMLNPVAPILEGIAAAVLSKPMPSAGWLGYSAGVAVVGLVAAVAFFKRVEPYFAESV
ncbi:MAG TPA: ABC transporter permease [Longimicrobiales bacterium]|nr:ABC transporter permease [Longimicrobiales bacterium]